MPLSSEKIIFTLTLLSYCSAVVLFPSSPLVPMPPRVVRTPCLPPPSVTVVTSFPVPVSCPPFRPLPPRSVIFPVASHQASTPVSVPQRTQRRGALVKSRRPQRAEPGRQLPAPATPRTALYAVLSTFRLLLTFQDTGLSGFPPK